MQFGRRKPVFEMNADKLLPDYMLSHSRRQYSSNSYFPISENSISLNLSQNVSVKGTETQFVATFLNFIYRRSVEMKHFHKLQNSLDIT
jgi:hypothetical protein